MKARMQEHRLTVPLNDEQLENLQSGDIVFLDGLIFTGRVGFYKKVLEEGLRPPIDIAGTCNVNFNSSPAVSEEPSGGYRISSITATASFRFARWMPQLFAELGVKALIGKGGMSLEAYREHFLPHRAVYLSTIGYGLGAVYGRAIRAVREVFFRKELGLAQAMWILQVERFGPLIVDWDLHGACLQEQARREALQSLAPLIAGYPSATLKRLGEVRDPDEEVV